MSNIDVETFFKKWGSETSLDYRWELREWMQSSYANPAGFWEELFSSLKQTDAGSNTVVFEQYDFYADCIRCHLGSGLTALKVIDSEGAQHSWTYDEIHECVEAQLPFWTENYSLNPGKKAALLLPYGIHFIVALMTALRLGLVISLLPLQDRYMGEGLLQKAVDALNPDLIITGSDSGMSGKNILELDLSLQSNAAPPLSSNAYLSNEILQIHFNPHLTGGAFFTAIEASRSYLIPLRDAAIALNLKPSMCWARPFLSMHREEPCCTLMALLAGATLVHISDEFLSAHPKALQNEPIHVLGVSLPLLELWLKNPGCPSSKLKLWHRNPLFGNDHSWRAFSELNHLGKIPSTKLLIDKERGGATLFSQPKPIDSLAFMHPSLGSPWKLLKVGGKNEPSTEGFGLFHLEPGTEDAHDLILAQIGDEWGISSTRFALREGYRYPIALIEEKVKTLDFVINCLLIPERHPQHFLSKQCMLLVFISPKEHHAVQQKTDAWSRQINALIKMEAGAAFTPDKMIFYALYPKLENGELDRRTVENQYRSGVLYHKQKLPIYRLLNLLKHTIYETQRT